MEPPCLEFPLEFHHIKMIASSIKWLNSISIPSSAQRPAGSGSPEVFIKGGGGCCARLAQTGDSVVPILGCTLLVLWVFAGWALSATPP